jgi:hypothetical protein
MNQHCTLNSIARHRVSFSSQALPIYKLSSD